MCFQSAWSRPHDSRRRPADGSAASPRQKGQYPGRTRYLDRELIQRRPISRRRATNVFITYLQQRWVLECRVGSEKSQIDSNMYILEFLHCLRGAPGINLFVGVVLDEDSSIINAFLCELPAKGVANMLRIGCYSQARMPQLYGRQLGRNQL